MKLQVSTVSLLVPGMLAMRADPPVARQVSESIDLGVGPASTPTPTRGPLDPAASISLALPSLEELGLEWPPAGLGGRAEVNPPVARQVSQSIDLGVGPASTPTPTRGPLDPEASVSLGLPPLEGLGLDLPPAGLGRRDEVNNGKKDKKDKDKDRKDKNEWDGWSFLDDIRDGIIIEGLSEATSGEEDWSAASVLDYLLDPNAQPYPEQVEELLADPAIDVSASPLVLPELPTPTGSDEALTTPPALLLNDTAPFENTTGTTTE